MKTQTKEELEPKHTIPYLEHGLKIQGKTHLEIQELSGIRNETVYTKEGNSRYGWADIADIKLILRPLSDLTKEIDLGEKYKYPMANIFYDWSVGENIEMSLNEHGELIEFWITDREESTVTREDWDFLFKHHFDVFGLIEKGLAISYNDLDN